MSSKTLLLLVTASALCALSMAIATALLAEQSGYYKNNEILNGKQQQEPVLGDMQKHTENWRLEIQQLQNQQEAEGQQGLQHQHIFDPFDFNNLRQLQEKQKQQQLSIQNDYFNNANELERQTQQQHRREEDGQQRNQQQLDNHYKQEQHQQEVQLLHPRRYKDNENSNNNNNINNKDDNNNNNSNNEGNEYKSGYSYYLFGNNKSKNNYNYNKGHNNNDNNDDDGDDDVVDYSNGNPNNGDWMVHTLAVPPSTHQDASNDFRLQLSNRNEPVSSKNKNYNNDNENGSPSLTYSINKSNDGHRNSGAGTNHAHNSPTHGDASNNNNKIIKNNNNKRENNRPNSSNGIGNGAASNTINGHTINIRDSQRFDQHYSEDDFVDPDARDYYTEDEELNMELPYGIQNVRKRTARQNTGLEYRGMSTTYQSLCPTKRVTIPLETVGYEYRPNHYIEVTCAHNYPPTQSYTHNKNKICSEVGFSCIQLNRTIHLIRRSKGANINCWESEVRIVPSGCECMWPQHSHGDIITYHDTQKRFNPEANVKATADYTPGQGYQQLPRQIELVSIDGTRREESNDGIGYETYFLN